MKPFVFIGLLSIACFAALFALRRAEGVSVEVKSCDADGRDAVVTIHFENRLSREVCLSYDVALTGNGHESRYGSAGARTLKLEHFASKRLGPDEKKDETIRIAFPPKVIVADAVILNLTRLPLKDSAAEKRPNQAPEPTALLVMPRAFARVTPSKAVAHL